MDQNPVNPQNGQEVDEFGIPIKKKAAAPEVDEFGIPIKKKEPSAPALRGPVGLGQGSKQAPSPQPPISQQGVPSTSRLTSVSGVGGKKPDQGVVTGTGIRQGELQKPIWEQEDFEKVKTQKEAEKQVFMARVRNAEKEFSKLTSGQVPSYVKPDVLQEVKQAGGFEQMGFDEYLGSVKEKSKKIEQDLQSLKNTYSEEYVTQRVKDYADNDSDFLKAYDEISEKYKGLAATATTQEQVDQYMVQADAELNKAYDVAKKKALTMLDEEFDKKSKEVIKKNSAGTDLIEQSGMKSYLDEITNDDNFNLLPFDQKQNILRAMYGVIGNQLAKRGKGDAVSLLKLKNQLDENYLQKFYYDKESKLSPFALKEYATEQIPLLEKKLAEAEKERITLGAVTKAYQQGVQPTQKGYIVDEETGEQIPVDEAISRYSQALESFKNLAKLPEDADAGIMNDIKKGLSYYAGKRLIPGVAVGDDLRNALNIFSALNSENQTAADKKMLQAQAMFDNYEAATGPLRSEWFESARSAAASFPALIEFATTGGITRGGVKAAEKYAEKKIKDYSKSAIRKYAVKPFIETVAVLAQTAANPQRVALNTIDRMTSEMQLVMGPEGDNLVAIADKSTGEDFDEAFLKGFGVTAAEFFTERAGGALPFYTKGVGGAIAGKSPDFIKRAYIAWYMRKESLNASKMYEILNRIGWNGLIAETAEEFAVQPLTAIITGDYKDPKLGPYSSILNGIIDPKTGELDVKNIKTTLIATSLISVPMAGFGVIAANLPQGKTEVRITDINGLERNAKIRTSVLEEIQQRGKQGAESLKVFLNERLPELNLSMDEHYVATNIVDSLLNQNSQQRLGGEISEADKAIIAELDKIDFEAAKKAAPEEVAPTEAAPEAVAPTEAAPEAVTPIEAAVTPTEVAPAEAATAVITEGVTQAAPSVPSPEAPQVEAKSIINEQAVVANTTKEGLITTENTIGDDVSQLDADPRNSEEFTYIDLKGEKRTDRGHGLAQNAKYRVFKGKSGKKYVQVGMTALDAGGRDGGASVIFEATGDVTPQMEQAIFDLKAENYKDGNVINEKGLNKFKADVTAILKGEAMQAAPAIEATTAPAAETAPSLPSPEATQTAEVNRQAVRVFEEISPLLDARKGADVKNKRDINKAISEKIKSNPKADFIYTNWNKLKKQLKFEHEGNCP